MTSKPPCTFANSYEVYILIPHIGPLLAPLQDQVPTSFLNVVFIEIASVWKKMIDLLPVNGSFMMKKQILE